MQTKGIVVDPEKIDFTDRNVLAMFCRGETRGIFQFESGGMQDLLMKMRPDPIEDLIAANALFRPGPMELIPIYCNRKHGREQVPKVHPIMDQILAETYGIMVYQEQVMQIFNQLGGIEHPRLGDVAEELGRLDPLGACRIGGPGALGALQQPVQGLGALLHEAQNVAAERLRVDDPVGSEIDRGLDSGRKGGASLTCVRSMPCSDSTRGPPSRASLMRNRRFL